MKTVCEILKANKEMTDFQLLQRVSAIRSALREEVRLSFETTKNEVYIPTTTVPTTVIDDSSQIPIKQQQKLQSKIMTPIPPECKCFYLLVKAEHERTGHRDFFFYNKDFRMLFNEVIPQAEIIPETSKLYIDGRFLVITDIHGESRRFSLKVKKEIFDIILKSQFPSTLQPFFYSYLACDRLPPVTNLTVGFLTSTVFTKEFLVSFIEIPENVFTADLTAQWILATESSYDVIFSSLMEEFLNKQKSADFQFDPENIISKIAKCFFSRDDLFNQNLSYFQTMFEDPYYCFCKGIKQLQFTPPTKMTLFIIYQETTRRFDQKSGFSALSRIIFSCGLIPFFQENSPGRIAAFNNLGMVQFNKVDERYINLLFDALRPLSRQPHDYYPMRCTQESYAAYGFLLNAVTKSGIDYLSILRKIEKDFPMLA